MTLGQGTVSPLGSASASLLQAYPGAGASEFQGARILVFEDDEEREFDVGLGESFVAGGQRWRLDHIEKFDNGGQIGGRIMEATVTRVE